MRKALTIVNFKCYGDVRAVRIPGKLTRNKDDAFSAKFAAKICVFGTNRMKFMSEPVKFDKFILQFKVSNLAI